MERRKPQVRTFYFHLKSPDALERDDEGVECEDIEQAYLRVCEAIPDVAAEILRNRKDPMRFSFLIANQHGQLLMTVPFTELVREHSVPSEKEENGLEMARRHVRQGMERLRRQGDLVKRLRAAGIETKESESLYQLFEELLREHRKHLDYVTSEHYRA
jgi:hypothetical protein